MPGQGPTTLAANEQWKKEAFIFVKCIVRKSYLTMQVNKVVTRVRVKDEGCNHANEKRLYCAFYNADEKRPSPYFYRIIIYWIMFTASQNYSSVWNLDSYINNWIACLLNVECRNFFWGLGITVLIDWGDTLKRVTYLDYEKHSEKPAESYLVKDCSMNEVRCIIE